MTLIIIRLKYIFLHGVKSTSNMYVHCLCNICTSMTRTLPGPSRCLINTCWMDKKRHSVRGLCKFQWCIHLGLRSKNTKLELVTQEIYLWGEQEKGGDFYRSREWREKYWVERLLGYGVVLKDVWPGRWVILEPKVPIRRISHVTRMGLPGYSHHAQSWTRSKHGSWSRETAAGAIGQLCSLQKAIRTAHFNGCHTW